MNRSTWKVVKDELTANTAMVMSEHPAVTEAAMDVLRQGGNAVDAAVAAGFAVGVCAPFMSGIGGGGHIVIYEASKGQTAVVDYAMRASKAATPNMYTLLRGTAGNFGWRVVKDEANAIGHRAITVPATVAGLCLALERFGTMPLKEVMSYAIRYAEEGTEVDIFLAQSIASRWRIISRFPHTVPLFMDPNGNILSPGGKLVQKDLANTLQQIAQEGPDAFYKGEIAQLMVKDIRLNGGLLSLEDLESYRADVFEPGLTTDYRGHTVVAVPGPCGGPTMIQALNILDAFDLPRIGHNTVNSLHLITEALRLAYADRFRLMGDPDFVSTPYEKLTSKQYAREQANAIDLEKASTLPPVVELQSTPSKEIPVGGASTNETTQICIVDKDGNAVSMTQTLQTYSGVIPPGTGVGLNGAMLWFNPEPGRANSIAGGKRILANMSPVLVLKDGKPLLATGAPGGRKITSAVLQVILNVVDHGLGIHEAISAPRIDGSGTEVQVDSRIPENVVDKLKSKGHKVSVVEEKFLVRTFAGPTGIFVDPQTGTLHGGLCQFDLTDALGY